MMLTPKLSFGLSYLWRAALGGGGELPFLANNEVILANNDTILANAETY